MAQNNRLSGASPGAACTGASEGVVGAYFRNRPSLSASAAFQRYLKQRRRLQKSAFLEKKPPTYPRPTLDPELPYSHLRNVKSRRPKPLSLSQLGLSPESLPSSPSTRKHKINSHLIRGQILQRRAKAILYGKREALYRRHRNPERALGVFLLRRLLWRSTRRPFPNMEFINQIRRLQADEPSSDEESGLILTAVSASDSRRQSATSNGKSARVPDKSNGEARVAGAKRKRDPAEVVIHPAAEAADEDPAVAKRAKVPQPAGIEQRGRARVQTAPSAVGAVVARPSVGEVLARKAEASKARDPAKLSPARANGEPAGRQQRAIEKSDSGAGSRRNSGPVTPESSKAAPTSSASQKPLQKEYYERRVHDMLADPLGFDDFVFDATKPTPRHVVRSFAQYRRRQTQPPPRLEMSGALSWAPGARPAASAKGKAPRSLAREAQRRAHQQRVQDRAQSLKGKSAGLATEGEGGRGARANDSAARARAHIARREDRALTAPA